MSILEDLRDVAHGLGTNKWINRIGRVQDCTRVDWRIHTGPSGVSVGAPTCVPEYLEFSEHLTAESRGFRPMRPSRREDGALNGASENVSEIA